MPAHCCGRRPGLPLRQSRWTVQACLQVVLKQLHSNGGIIAAATIQAGEQAASLWLRHAWPAGQQVRRAACRGSTLSGRAAEVNPAVQLPWQRCPCWYNQFMQAPRSCHHEGGVSHCPPEGRSL